MQTIVAIVISPPSEHPCMQKAHSARLLSHILVAMADRAASLLSWYQRDASGRLGGIFTVPTGKYIKDEIKVWL
ncbi:MAG: hypothetical protein KAH86_09425 [Methanosarcinales archaeon]|nr:hypothetical protein [Methanosarcinales archaeon]